MHLGRRWEDVGASALADLVGRPSPSQTDFVPRAVASFVHDSAVERAIQAAGLPHADAVLIGPLEGRLALQPVDFKWSLEVARASQVAADALEALLTAEVEAIRNGIQERIEGGAWGLDLEDHQLPPLEQLNLLDGLFLSPDHAANRAFLTSQANRRQESPLEPHQAVLRPVDGREFFSPLPGWEVAEALAAQDGARRALDTLEGAEHYYRLGAGVLGALTAQKRSIFDPSIPRIAPLDELSGLRRSRRLLTLEQLIAHMDRLMAARAELLKSFNQLGRKIYPFSAFRTALKTAGVVLPDRTEQTPEQRRWSRLYGLVQRDLTNRLAGEGRAMVGNGQTDAQAVANLSARSPELAAQAAAIATRLIAEETANGGSGGANGQE
jgi:hypothetical protein